jgi:hypothetical protein
VIECAAVELRPFKSLQQLSLTGVDVELKCFVASHRRGRTAGMLLQIHLLRRQRKAHSLLLLLLLK